ncbi:TRAP transporter small permease [Hydrogenophaga taeniospiralis]|uniref:TRAP transporter small permease n=1 Tax=Hydrogenophaga TaxID=47420 RepID=UPI001CF94065|nr:MULTISPECIES: TRAP transporter small permease [Hydrogenophaga]MCB4365524.1 TRAP transporter small permease [Hydrogenophaga taeniospiralis]UJW83083.1 TRAP transporter small permease [Hydrogenophaga sp. SL48]
MALFMKQGTALAPFVHGTCDHLLRLVRWAVLGLTGVMLVSLSLQVVMRYVFGHAASWTEELALACFTWGTLLAIAAGVRDAIHVRMDLLVDRLPEPLRTGMERLVSLAIAFTGVFTAWSGVRYVADSTGFTSAAIGYPLTGLYAAAPVCGVLVAVFALEHALLGPGARPDASTTPTN